MQTFNTLVSTTELSQTHLGGIPRRYVINPGAIDVVTSLDNKLARTTPLQLQPNWRHEREFLAKDLCDVITMRVPLTI